jgi:Domain of Unknown Function (DUF1080)
MENIRPMKIPSSLALLAVIFAPLAAAEPNTLTPEEKTAGFELIFDGKTLDGFRNFKEEKPNPKWQVRDGAIVLTEKGGGNLMTVEQFDDFEFRFEFRIAAHGNSGIMWRVAETANQPFLTGPEFQILDSHSKTGYPHEIVAGNLSGGLYGIIPVKPEFTKPTGEWNEGSIRVEGAKITLTLNGNVTADIDTTSDKWKELLGNSKFAKWPKFNKEPKGHLVFQDHNDVVEFRTLRVMKLK